MQVTQQVIGLSLVLVDHVPEVADLDLVLVDLDLADPDLVLVDFELVGPDPDLG